MLCCLDAVVFACWDRYRLATMFFGTPCRPRSQPSTREAYTKVYLQPRGACLSTPTSTVKQTLTPLPLSPSLTHLHLNHHPQHVNTPQQLRALARDVAIRDARRQSDRKLPRVSDVETAVFVAGDGNEPPEWWSAFESGYT